MTFPITWGQLVPKPGQLTVDAPVFGGQQLRNIPPRRRARLGLVRTFQSLSLFRTMTVAENISLGSGRSAKGISGTRDSKAVRVNSGWHLDLA